MAKKRLLPGIIVIILVFGAALTACTDKSDKSINGSWASNGFEIKLKDGKFEETVNDVSFRKGTYTAKNGEIAIVPTHIFGAGFNTLLGLSEEDSGFESKWYSINDFLAALKTVMIKMGLSEDEAEKYNDGFVNSFSSADNVSTYYINGNTLSLTTDGVTLNFTRK